MSSKYRLLQNQVKSSKNYGKRQSTIERGMLAGCKAGWARQWGSENAGKGEI